jgi:uncharacterized protein (TIGR00369 family)
MSFSMTAPKSLRELFDHLGLQEVPSTDGTVTMEMPVDERTVNTAGGLQGGLIATMADVTAGQLASRSTPFGMAIATTDLFIRYLRPIKVGPARAVARILRTGKRSVVVQVDIYRGNDDEIGATATVNFAAVDSLSSVALCPASAGFTCTKLTLPPGVRRQASRTKDQAVVCLSAGIHRSATARGSRRPPTR